ncbi:polysaccharide export protein [Rhizobiaceae bacterium n13]|uniref:Polysaccharide export protein n=1 Tax=Ferirhizobium litorale TaxID=2927786 RepID=A0AAE3Q7V0_9HYPH|nr:polysaccharide biosynthesis/export family protein [Fererhizobium litorale]MDI7860644.1 polysaccharide export protein [Fererhizobium litorale]MDI7920792.1 polysaccharide export protein [Fererhizobium litorale]
MIEVKHVEIGIQRWMRPVLRLIAGGTLLALAGCNAFPSDGPTASEVMHSSSGTTANPIPSRKLVFDVVNVDQRIASNVNTLGQPGFSRTFGFGGGVGTPVIGVGDKLDVTIFEAGPDGLFSTAENKATNIPVTVQPDGTGQIPYVGSVRFAGTTIDQARASIVSALKAKAVEPDVTVSLSGNASRTVSVSGDVSKPGVVPLGLAPMQLTEILAFSGGTSKAPYDSYVTLTRSGRVGKAQLQSLIDNPKDDIYVRPGDKIFVTYDPQTFTALGSTRKSAKIDFNASRLSVVEAAALAGGGDRFSSDAKGYFIFRYETEAVYRHVVGESRFRELLSQGMLADGTGRYPIVYRIDMLDPQSYLVAQSFPIRNKDVLYLSRHPASDFIKFMSLFNTSAVVAWNINRIADN